MTPRKQTKFCTFPFWGKPGLIRCCLAVAVFLNFLSSISASVDSVKSFVLPEDTISSIHLADYIAFLPVNEHAVSAEEVLQFDSSDFMTYQEFDQKENTKELWSRLRMYNPRSTSVNGFISFCNDFDIVDVYLLNKSKLVYKETIGTQIHPLKKFIPNYHNLTNFTLEPEQNRVFYFHIQMQSGARGRHFHHIYIRDGKTTIHSYMKTFTSQAFYSGIMILFFLVGLFMFLNFKERIFLFYALLILFFNLYFLETSGITKTYLYFYPNILAIHNGYLIISGIVLFAFLFVSGQLELKKRMPGYYKFLGILSLIIVFFSPTYKFYLRNIWADEIALNSLLMIWLIALVIPIVRISLTGYRAAKVLLLSVCLLIAGASLYILDLLRIIEMRSLSRDGFQIGAIGFSGMLFYGLFERISNIQKERLTTQIAKEKSDELLFNVLPADVAEELKEKGHSEARHFDDVTVLFTDFSKFTEISEMLTPKELVDEINICFKKFDEIIEKHGIEKIKTVGDAYMAAGGLYIPRRSESRDVVNAALEMQAFMYERKEQLNRQGIPAFEMRAGIHSGPVVAGVVGTRKYQYDIWGDTVNTASRMESHGVTGRVNISQTTYDLVRAESGFTFEYRGKVETKGKGEVEMYFVVFRNALVKS